MPVEGRQYFQKIESFFSASPDHKMMSSVTYVHKDDKYIHRFVGKYTVHHLGNSRGLFRQFHPGEGNNVSVKPSPGQVAQDAVKQIGLGRFPQRTKKAPHHLQ